MHVRKKLIYYLGIFGLPPVYSWIFSIYFLLVACMFHIKTKDVFSDFDIMLVIPKKKV